MNCPKVAVIIPTYNRWPIVARAVASVLAQTHGNTECVVVDDASTDDTRRRLREDFGRRIHLVELAKNAEKSAARNAGVRATQAEYVCMLDSDDELTEHSVEDRVAVFLRDRAFDGVAYGLAWLPEDEPVGRWVQEEYPEGDVLLSYVRRHFVNNNGYMLSRRNMLEQGMYQEHLTHREDIELLIRLAARFEFRSCGAFVNRVHRTKESAQADFGKLNRQGLSMLESVRSNPFVVARLGAHIRELERSEHWEWLRGLYKAGRYKEYRRACRTCWGLFSGCRSLQRTILRRWMFSCLLQFLAPRQPPTERHTR